MNGDVIRQNWKVSLAFRYDFVLTVSLNVFTGCNWTTWMKFVNNFHGHFLSEGTLNCSTKPATWIETKTCQMLWWCVNFFAIVSLTFILRKHPSSMYAGGNHNADSFDVNNNCQLVNVTNSLYLVYVKLVELSIRSTYKTLLNVYFRGSLILQTFWKL